MDFSVTDEDIVYAEKILLPTGCHFDKESIEFIKSFDSLDVQACPGSGKTTALLAKILILSTKPPLLDNAGICVLTHTNVAIDEIKNKLSNRIHGITAYPNFVGTIQKFVNTYLAIPAFRHYYGTRPIAIDNDQFYYAVKRNWSTPYYMRKQKYPTPIEDFRFSFENFKISKKINSDDPFIGENTDTYKMVSAHKRKIIKSGYMCFDDAYALANKYLIDFPELKSLFSSRFPYVFIDEIQDSGPHQIKLLDKLFDSNCVIQRIGDKNQAIYSGVANSEKAVWRAQKTITINGSKRISQSIANAIVNFGVEKQALFGNEKKDKIIPKILLFDDNSIEYVIPYFLKIIKQEKITKLVNNPVIKIVGAVKKPNNNDKHTIVNYWPDYENMKKNDKNISRLDGYIRLSNHGSRMITPKNYNKKIVSGILYFLKINGIKYENRNFTKKTFEEYIQTFPDNLYDEYKLLMANWVFDGIGGKDIHEDIKIFLRSLYVDKNVFKKEDFDTKICADFFTRIPGWKDDTDKNELPEKASIPPIDTIHGVKGETHTATLLLETFKNYYDLSYIVDCFNPSSTPQKSITRKKFMRLAYVAMSRPTHLLCVAMHKNTVGNSEKKIENDLVTLQANLDGIWEVVEI